MNPFYVLAAFCVLIVLILFAVLPVSYALVYALFPGALAVIFVSIPGIADYFTDGSRSRGPVSEIPLGYKAAFVCFLVLPALWFLFPNSGWVAPVVGVYAVILALIFVVISDFRRRNR